MSLWNHFEIFWFGNKSNPKKRDLTKRKIRVHSVFPVNECAHWLSSFLDLSSPSCSVQQGSGSGAGQWGRSQWGLWEGPQHCTTNSWDKGQTVGQWDEGEDYPFPGTALTADRHAQKNTVSETWGYFCYQVRNQGILCNSHVIRF